MSREIKSQKVSGPWAGFDGIGPPVPVPHYVILHFERSLF